MLLIFLKANGYEIYNYSFFDFTGNPKPINTVFLPERKALITSQTFTSRAYKRSMVQFCITIENTKYSEPNLHNNIKVDSLTRKIVLTKRKQLRNLFIPIL